MQKWLIRIHTGEPVTATAATRLGFMRGSCVFGKGEMRGSRTRSEKQAFLFQLFEKHLVGTILSISQ